MVYEFYNQRRRRLAEAEPNQAHFALAELEKSGRPLVLVTQNVDDLHERAGSSSVIHMHGELKRALCLSCRKSCPWPGDLGPADGCPSCGGHLRPDVVWFGETPYRMGEIERYLSQAGVFASIGTSGTVYPAAGFLAAAKASGAKTVEVNLAPAIGGGGGLGEGGVDEGFYGPATRSVPKWVASVLGGAGK
jgi:NAD-dependent deacetylase